MRNHQQHHVSMDQFWDPLHKAPSILVIVTPVTAQMTMNDPANPRLRSGTMLQDVSDVQSVETAEQKKQLMETHHSLGHFGGMALMRAIIAEGYNWQNMSRDCADYVAACSLCQRYTIGKKGYHPYTPITASFPMDHISFDLFQLTTSQERYNYVLIIVDACTRFVLRRKGSMSHGNYSNYFVSRISSHYAK